MMNALHSEGLASAMAEAALRGCLLVLIAAIALRLFRTKSATVECAIWGGVLAGSLAMPIIQAATPPIFFRAAAPLAETSSHAANFALNAQPLAPLSIAPAAAPFDWLTLVYCVGLAAGLIRLALGFAAGESLRRRSKPTRLAAPFEIRESDNVSVPMTFGWPRAFVVLPATWPFWDERKLNAVLLHEGAHIARGDFLLNALANLNAAIFWFSPHAWWLRHRLTDVSEQASDDRALSSFGDGVLYADVLLSFAGRRQAPSMALPMARGALSARIERALDGERKLTAALGLKAGLLLGAALSAAVYLSAGVSLAEAPARPARNAIPEIAAAPTPPTPNPAPEPQPAPAPAPTPMAPATPNEPATFVWTDVDTALAGDDWKATSKRAAERARDAAQDARDAFDGDHNKASWSWQSGDHHSDFDYLTVSDDRIEFVLHGAKYRITDPEVCNQANEIYGPVRDLGEEQSDIGEEQSKLGEKMSELGARQSEVAVETGALKDKIRARMAEIEAIASKARLTQDELGEIQSRLGDLQGELGDLQGQAAESQSDISGDQAALAEEMAALGRKQEALGRKQAAASSRAEIKIRKLIEQAMAEGRADRLR